jgi:hypothetical protein
VAAMHESSPHHCQRRCRVSCTPVLMGRRSSTRPSLPTPPWPFPSLLSARLRLLPPEQRAAMAAAATMVGSRAELTIAATSLPHPSQPHSQHPRSALSPQRRLPGRAAACILLPPEHRPSSCQSPWPNHNEPPQAKLGMKTDGIFPVPSRSVFYIFLSVSIFARSRFRICGSRKWCFPSVSE